MAAVAAAAFCALEHRRGGAMIAVNVSQLLRAPVGTSRSYEIRDEAPEFAEELSLLGPVEGLLKLTRTNHGILADFAYSVPIEQECGRCLDPAHSTIESQFTEEFLPTINVVTGMPEVFVSDPDEPRVNANHELDLTESIRQDILLQQPLQPLCRPDCPGLCVSCGRELANGTCDCERDESASAGGQLSRLGELLKAQLPPTS
jgi:uncharacterized protein